MRARRSSLVGGAGALALVAGLVVGRRLPQAAVSPSAPVVINEVYGGGGNAGATYRRDFIELAQHVVGPGDAQQLVGAVRLGDRHDLEAPTRAHRDRSRRAPPTVVAEGAGARRHRHPPDVAAWRRHGAHRVAGTAGKVAPRQRHDCADLWHAL